MPVIFYKLLKRGIIYAILISLILSTSFGGCKKREKIFTIGICLHASLHLPVFEGFKEGMTEMGYIEGKDVKYIFDGVLGSNQEAIDSEIKKLLSQRVDILLTTGNPVVFSAKSAVEGTDVPVIFGTSGMPVESGLVKSLSRPGGNLTGIQLPNTSEKLLEMLTQIIPMAKKKIYLPYNPDDDKISTVYMEGMKKTASQLGIEIIFQEVHSLEDALSAIEDLPEDVAAIYRASSLTLDERNEELSRAAINRGIFVVSHMPLDESVMVTLTSDLFVAGKQAAHQAHLIRLGERPADIPVETAEFYLTINLNTAEKIGITIPNSILAQANYIIY